MLLDELSSLKILPIAILDYTWIVFIYFTIAFWLEVVIDGYILEEYNYEEENKKPSWLLYIQIFLQLSLQGFIAFIIYFIFEKTTSPFHGIMNYNSRGQLGNFLRVPGLIITIILLLSNTLKQRTYLLYSRFNPKIKANTISSAVK